MRKSIITPPPWKLDPKTFYIEGANGEYICHATRMHDAVLIIAAPLMLEALEEILRCHNKGGFGVDGEGGLTMAKYAVEVARGLK